jgi:hypothetical protein
VANDLLRPFALILNGGLLILVVLMVLQRQYVLSDPGDVLLAILLVAAPATALLQILRSGTRPRTR